jgi:chorismate mutase
MSNDGPPADALDEIRRDIDRIDESILTLLEERFAAVERVRAAKRQTGSDTQASPIRPAREALILRRILEAPAPRVPADLRLRIWRAIVASSTLSQAPVSIHVSAGLSNSARLRLLVRDHFGTIPTVSHMGEASVLEAAAANPCDVAVVALDSPWLDAFLTGRAGRAHAIGCLPWMAPSGSLPEALVFGHAIPEPTGADETILITDGQLPRDFTPAPLWQTRLLGRRLTSLPGFLSEHNQPLIGLKRSNAPLALTLLGRYPSPLEVKS